MPNGGELMIRTGLKGPMCRIAITDTGIGMSPEVLEKIFNAYYSTKKSGSGLGMPTAKRIINDHGGEIEVQSEEGKGSSFSVLLPLPVQSD